MTEIPRDVGEVHTGYGKLIQWEVRHSLHRHGIPSGDLFDDLCQDVYVRLLETRYLDRCRVYYADRPGQFSTSLTVLVRRLVHHQLDRLRTRTACYTRLAEDLRGATAPSCSAQIEARLLLDAVGRRVVMGRPATRRRVRHFLDVALTHGTESTELAPLLQTTPGLVRYHLSILRRVGRGMVR